MTFTRDAKDSNRLYTRMLLDRATPWIERTFTAACYELATTCSSFTTFLNPATFRTSAPAAALAGGH